MRKLLRSLRTPKSSNDPSNSSGGARNSQREQIAIPKQAFRCSVMFCGSATAMEVLWNVCAGPTPKVFPARQTDKIIGSLALADDEVTRAETCRYRRAISHAFELYGRAMIMHTSDRV